MAIEEVAQGNPLSTSSDGPGYLQKLTDKFLMKPKNADGIAGFVFDYEAETKIDLQAEITDHYAEDNTAINDHVAIRPYRMTLRGFVSELAFAPPGGVLGVLNAVQSRLTEVPAYLGPLTPGGLAKVQGAITKATNITNTINQAISKVKNVVGFFSNSDPQTTKQGKAYSKLQGLFYNKKPFIVTTPYGTILNNMVIESLSFLQDETTKYWTDITVVLKQLNFVKTIKNSPDKNSNRNYQQTQPQNQKGQTRGKSVFAAGFDAAKRRITGK